VKCFWAHLIGCAGLLAGGAESGRAAELVNYINAVVDNAVITRGQVEAEVLMLVEDYKRRYGRQPEVFQQKIAEAFRDSLNRSLEHHLMLHDFESSGYNLPESVIEEIVQAEIKRTYGNRATLTQTLQSRGITYEKWRAQVKERFLVRQLQLKNVQQDTIISPYKIETYYNEHKTDYKVEDQVKLRLIMLNKGDAAQTEAHRALAQEVRAKILAGAAFSEMASVYSQGTQRAEDGAWGWADRTKLRPELAEVAFRLKAGELSDIIETPEAFFLMLVEEVRLAHHRPVAEVRAEIEQTLLRQERDRLHEKYIEKLKKKTFVRKFEF
jgi:parvulin-like peptidyl-prolyl isomerase